MTITQRSCCLPFLLNFLRRIEGVSRFDRVRNVDIREKLRQEGVLDMVKSRQEK